MAVILSAFERAKREQGQWRCDWPNSGWKVLDRGKGDQAREDCTLHTDMMDEHETSQLMFHVRLGLPRYGPIQG